MDNQPTNLNCPACGAPLEPDGTSTIVHCKFCGNTSLLPGQADASASALDAVRQLLGGGNLNGAVEHYRNTYGVDASEAQQAVDAIQAGRMVILSSSSRATPDERVRTLKSVQRLLAAGNKIEAIKVYRGTFDVSLERAKEAVDHLEAGQNLTPVGDDEESVPPTKPVKRSRARGCFVAAISVLLSVLAIGLIAFFIVRSGALNFYYNVDGPVALVSTASGSAPNFAAGFYNSDKDTRFVGLVDGTNHKLLWQAAALSGSSGPDEIYSGSDLIYAANGTTLLAYRMSDGSLAWQTEMPDKMNGVGVDMLLTAGRLITDNADQTIQAYDAETGSPAWSKRLAGEDTGLRLMGNMLVILDQTTDPSTYGLIFLDPVTGNQQNVITPACTYNGSTFGLDTGVGLDYDAAENAIYIVYDSSNGCVQRLDMGTGKIAWELDSDNSFDFTSDGFQSLMTDSTLYFNNGSDLLAVDKASGKGQVLLTNPDYTILPLAQNGNDLIVRAYKTRGSGRFELWGVDATGGSMLWQMDMQGAQPIDPPDVMSGLIDNNDYGYTWQLMPAGLVVLKFEGQPNQIALQTFDPATDNSLGSRTIPLPSISGDFYDIPTVLSWQENIVYLNLDSKICALDLTSGKLTVIY